MSFRARYDGECVAMDDAICAGDEIESDPRGGYSHPECLRAEARQVTCPTCFTIKPCPCDDDVRDLLDQILGPQHG